MLESEGQEDVLGVVVDEDGEGEADTVGVDEVDGGVSDGDGFDGVGEDGVLGPTLVSEVEHFLEEVVYEGELDIGGFEFFGVPVFGECDGFEDEFVCELFFLGGGDPENGELAEVDAVVGALVVEPEDDALFGIGIEEGE